MKAKQTLGTCRMLSTKVICHPHNNNRAVNLFLLDIIEDLTLFKYDRLVKSCLVFWLYGFTSHSARALLDGPTPRAHKTQCELSWFKELTPGISLRL